MLRHRNSAVIRGSSLLFNLISLIGAFAVSWLSFNDNTLLILQSKPCTALQAAGAAIPFIELPSPQVCEVRAWLTSLAITLTLAYD